MKTKEKYLLKAERVRMFRATKLEVVSQIMVLSQPGTNLGNPFLQFQQELSDMFDIEKVAHFFRPEPEEPKIEKPAAAE